MITATQPPAAIAAINAFVAAIIAFAANIIALIAAFSAVIVAFAVARAACAAIFAARAVACAVFCATFAACFAVLTLAFAVCSAVFIVFCAVFILPKAVSKFYYDPNEAAGAYEGMTTTRMSLDLSVYSELFLPGNYRDQVNAVSKDGAVMGISHKILPLYGVQFHPEAVLTEYGHELLENFCKIAERFQQEQERAAIEKTA